ncbi:hypothetical protein SAMN05216548_1268 [Faunimonas pinastri]|uniref:Uncharacterized protein n=1 Tax=Faunimonas pinastri TaxID=1855383 RepID=A0A1H9Q8U7_9HYPH|nr:hypothetical protein [Faunimonas pinastri]SER56822.1 hypothetical protein SAMN05216548_1268 [Faunimonas pinastri]
MGKKTIQRAQSEDFEILEDGKKIGTVRVKASGLLWSPKGKHSWFRVSVEQFAEFAEESGTPQKK